jgi:hypothetical protein
MVLGSSQAMKWVKGLRSERGRGSPLPCLPTARSDWAGLMGGMQVASLGIDLLLRYLPLVRLWRALQLQRGDSSQRLPIYMASLDVVKSFDSIKHDKLMTVVESMLPHEEVCIQDVLCRYCLWRLPCI